jgi:hypothetical protein
MPHSNFDRRLDVIDNGRGLTASGPLPIEDDDESVLVVAVVTQQPAGDEPADDAEPAAVTCHGRVHLDEARLRAAGANAVWSFNAQTIGGGVFRTGWARGTALAVTTKTNGDLETYSWSAWVWLKRP